MFERYTEPATRAIFYARATAIINKAPMIDSTHLLWGLMWPDAPRAQVLFRLREKFPQYRRSPHRSLLRATWKSQDLRLTDEAKKTLAYASMEADAMGDAWVDTDHLLLGILRESGCQAAQHLTTAGLTLEKSRPLVMENQSIAPGLWPRDSAGGLPLVAGVADVEVTLVEGPPERKALCRKAEKMKEMARSSLLQPAGRNY
jgi:ATP-dependent Clp protease ATP-binding subunit ClpA